MTEPPYKRARPNRPDSKTMWDEADRRGAAPSGPREREDQSSRREGRGDRRDDRDRDRRYRSRSPRDSRRRDSDRDSRGGRDERNFERDRERNSKGGDRSRGGREDRNGDHRPRDHDRDRRERDRSRSRSPRRDRDRDLKRDEGVKDRPKVVEKEQARSPHDRTDALPVSFKVASTNGQDHDRMELDASSVSISTPAQAINPTLKSNTKSKAKSKGKQEEVKQSIEDGDDEVVIEEDEDMKAMQAMMGFGGFGTTHQRKVEGNNVGAVRKEKRTEYRQYMNRVGGFNRPLSPGK